MRRFWSTFLLLAAFSPTACSNDNDTAKLAQEGLIDTQAPVQAVLDITINAPVDRVWSILANVNGWPKWHTAISSASIAGLMTSGKAFEWHMGGTKIHSTLVVVQSPTELVWTGKASGATAVHVWRLQRLPENRTLVHTEESMRGPLLSIFYSSKDLYGSDQRWLDDLKAAAEK